MNAHLPSPLVVYLMYAAVVLLQGPTATLIHHDALWTGIALSQLGAIALPTTLVVWWRGYDWRTLFPLTRPTLAACVLIVIGTIGVAMLTHAGVEWTKLHFHTPPLLEDRIPELVTIHSFADALFKFGVIGLLPAFIEEGFFRGFCQSALMPVYGGFSGCCIAALLFAVAHNNLAYLHLYFLLGLYLGLLRHYGRSLWWPILAHAVNNGWTLYAKGIAT